MLFRFEALEFDWAVELRPAERAPTGGQRIVLHVNARNSTTRVVAFAVRCAYVLHQLVRGPVNSFVHRLRHCEARNVEHRTGAWRTVVIGKSIAAARPKLEVVSEVLGHPCKRQGRVDVLPQGQRRPERSRTPQ